MKQILLIAWREYRQYVFSRGFLIFLFMFPLGFIGVSAGLGLAEQTKPVRYFVVHDETGLYEDEIVARLERRHIYDTIESLDVFFRASLGEQSADLPGPFAPAPIDNQRITAFEEAGGAQAALAAAEPMLGIDALPFVAPKAAYVLIDPPQEAQRAANISEAEALLRPYLLEENQIMTPEGPRPLFAAVLIPAEFSAEKDAPDAQFWSRHITDPELQSRITAVLTDTLRRTKYNELGVANDAVERIETINAPIASFRPDRAPDQAQLGLKDRIESVLPAVMTYMLLVIIFGVGNLLLTNTIEERSNKIVEILLSSVTANQLMMGKLIGIAAVGLTMPTVFIAGGIGVSTTIDTGGEESVAATIINALTSSNLLLVYLFYFLCAYIIFAMIFLAIGAISNSLQDAQSYMGPVMLLVFAPLPFMIMVFQEPNGIIASILTWIPIYTPYAIMMRAAADPPLWEILGATALMLAFAFFLMRTMGRIFRQAILQASPPKMREVWRLAKKEAA